MNIEQLLIIPDKHNIAESVRLAEEYSCGFEYQDFCVPALLDDEAKLERTIADYEKVKKLPRACTLHGVFFDISVFSADEKIAAVSDFRVEQSLRTASRLGAKGVVFHTNYTPNFLMPAYRTGWVNRNVEYWTEKLEKYPDTEIYMENMFDMDWRLLTMLAERMKNQPRFGICYDYAHAHVFGNTDEISEWTKAFAPYVKHMHINDNDWTDDLHLPVGDGKIDWMRFKEDYETYFPHASVLVEVTGTDKTEKSLRFLRQL